MPRIPDHVLNCSVYLYPSREAAQKGEKYGGSGFLVGTRYEDDENKKRVCLYAVTCSHIAGAGGTFIRVNRKAGDFDIIDASPPDLWIYHPEADDVAVFPIVGLSPQKHDVAFVPTFDDLVVTEAKLREWSIGPGDETYTIGRFVNHEGRQRNTPSARFGEIAMMPFEPIVIESSTNRREQIGFLVEARSLPGYSGSPVFVQVGGKRPSGVNLMSTHGPFLLGIDCAHTSEWEPVYEKPAYGDPTRTDYSIKASTGYMVVVPAWKLLDILLLPELVDQRKIDWERNQN